MIYEDGEMGGNPIFPGEDLTTLWNGDECLGFVGEDPAQTVMSDGVVGLEEMR